MIKIYETIKQIHKIIKKINEKYGLNINIDDYSITPQGHYLYFNGYSYYVLSDTMDIEKHINNVKNGYIKFIQAPQIRIILKELEDLLGDNPDYVNFCKRYKRLCRNCSYDISDSCYNPFPYLKSEALCAKWIDGLNPLIDREPERVLEELLEELNKI